MKRHTHDEDAQEACDSTMAHEVNPSPPQEVVDPKVLEWESSGKLPCPHGRFCYLWCPHCMGFS
jgi:hypothetical protein